MNFYCELCKKQDKQGKYKFLNDKGFLCTTCYFMNVSRETFHNFMVVETVNLKLYQKNNGNVPKSRIDMIKSRCLAPHGNGEVVMRRKNGSPSDKLAYNY